MATREITINLRAGSAQKELIDRAAQAQGKKRTEFMLEAACEKAEQVLIDRAFFPLEAEGFRQFTKALDGPLRHPDRVARLLAKKSPWEK
jgi:uncharacterized protein (DUF1778 family)